MNKEVIMGNIININACISYNRKYNKWLISSVPSNLLTMNKSIPIVLYMQMLILVWQHFFAANSTAKKKKFWYTCNIFFLRNIYNCSSQHSETNFTEISDLPLSLQISQSGSFSIIYSGLFHNIASIDWIILHLQIHTWKP